MRMLKNSGAMRYKGVDKTVIDRDTGSRIALRHNGVYLVQVYRDYLSSGTRKWIAVIEDNFHCRITMRFRDKKTLETVLGPVERMY